MSPGESQQRSNRVAPGREGTVQGDREESHGTIQDIWYHTPAGQEGDRRELGGNRREAVHGGREGKEETLENESEEEAMYWKN